MSLLLHGLVIVLVRFRPPDPSILFNRMPLEIVLVNARSMLFPTNPEVLAQANLDGGGNTDEKRRIKSPLPAQPVEEPTAVLAQAAKRQIEEETRQRKLLSTLSNAPKLSSDEVKKQLPTPSKHGMDLNALRQQASEIARLEAEISREQDIYNQRPRKAFVGARSKAVVEARYVDDWRLKIERIGNRLFPTNKRGERLYGRLLVTVEIHADGRRVLVGFDRRPGFSNDPELEAAARQIVESAAPFPPLPSGVVDAAGKPADILSITRTWTFRRGGDNSLEQLSSN
ncbi:energy transducer TonB family protein [Chitinimonas sp. BJB300]|uniref:energy transducer TonB family protein n=1 Tax=Chitinimonas sp. BJB300 TaxID=1559339 RepID=UPI000C0EE10C|nr:energy transducer TonB [Chitinimonas sp. BJB300]PHV10875.1 energy transducer TonB [Chitinimonas sp. BJB300]